MALNLTAPEAAGLVPDRATVALAGAHSMEPVGLAARLALGQASDLHLITVPTGGLAVDLIIASGRAARVETAQVSLGEMGLAPGFRTAVERGWITPLDAT